MFLPASLEVTNTKGEEALDCWELELSGRGFKPGSDKLISPPRVSLRVRTRGFVVLPRCYPL